MKRNPRKLKWTKAFRKSAGKEMVVDSTLTFAARRNIPTRYNRDLVATTLKAMQRVSEIRARRERVFYKNRMAGNKERQKAANRKLVAENEHLLPKARVTEPMDAEILENVEETVIIETPGQRAKAASKRRLLKSANPAQAEETPSQSRTSTGAPVPEIDNPDKSTVPSKKPISDEAKPKSNSKQTVVRTGLAYKIGYAQMTSTGRGGAGNIYEASLIRERKRIEDEKIAKEKQQRAQEEALRDVEEGVPAPKRAFIPSR
ncbi:MAG: ATPase-activating ribosome biosynthesis protein [Thelocarpon superellum]|nr:MAG: ATPase-activating ribosome biosynthesis protein [Thelocarpon superellum]